MTASISREHISRNLVLKDNQWLCQYNDKYKHTGDFRVTGTMPADIEWMEDFGDGGSGEDHYFVIEKISDTDYVMRSSNKCKRYAVVE